MLHEDPLMLDIDVNHWRNLQSLLLESAKAKRRIIVIHENGEIQKFIHTRREQIERPVDRIDDPHQAAKAIYEANAGKVDFVAVFERRAFDRYMGEWQGTWRPDEDLDAFVQRTYATLDKYADGIVTYPGPARDTLGLQWRLGASYPETKALVESAVPANSTVVLGVFDGDALWATLVLGFDADHRARVVTTVDTSRLAPGQGRQQIASNVVDWVNQAYGPCSLGLFAGLDDAKAWLASKDKAAKLSEIAGAGRLVASPVPDALAGFISRT